MALQSPASTASKKAISVSCSNLKRILFSLLFLSIGIVGSHFAHFHWVGLVQLEMIERPLIFIISRRPFELCGSFLGVDISLQACAQILNGEVLLLLLWSVIFLGRGGLFCSDFFWFFFFFFFFFLCSALNFFFLLSYLFFFFLPLVTKT